MEGEAVSTAMKPVGSLERSLNESVLKYSKLQGKGAASRTVGHRESFYFAVCGHLFAVSSKMAP
jgi:hypothetical protein